MNPRTESMPPLPAPLHWNAEALWESIAPLLAGFTVEVLPQIDSTNDELMRRARRGSMEPILLVAEQQSAGKGRMGRGWRSSAQAPNDSLTFSLGLPLSPSHWSGLSLAVGLSVVQSLHPRLQLKWPNDLWLEDRKMGGILIETLSQGPLRYTVIGIGLNLNTPDATGLRTPPSGLRELQPQAQAPSVLAALGLPLVRSILAFAQTGFAPLCQAFAQRDALFGRELLCSDGLSGIAQGVDAQGALLLQTDQGLRKISSAEVSVRPVATAMVASAAQQPRLDPPHPTHPPHPLSPLHPL